LRWVGVVLLSGIFLNANADPARTSRSGPQKNKYSHNSSSDSSNIWDEKTFYLFGGADLGLASYGISSVSTDAKRSGVDLGARALAAYYTKNWVIDGGLGFALLSSSGTNTAGLALKVTTRTGYLDFSPRYRFNKKWQFGPELQYWISADNGLDANIYSLDSNHALMAGVQGIYEWMKGSNKYRFGARWNTPTNISARSLNVFQLFFQIGFSPGGGSTEDEIRNYEEMKPSDLEKVEAEPMEAPAPPKEAVTAEPESEPEPVVMSTPAPVEVQTPVIAPAGPQAKMVMSLDVNDLPFEMDSARLPKYNRDRVKEIGRFLGEHAGDWKSLVVSGHTDEQGKKLYNMKLSKARADTVRQLLGEGGAPINKIKTVGYGPTKPLDRRHNEAAWAKNRRVELEFQGVRDGLVIQKAFQH